MQELFNKLKEPFHPNDLDWRIGNCGFQKDGKPWAMCLAYVTARSVMERLDDAVGPGNWSDTYQFIGDKGVMCSLSIKIGNEWIVKSNGSDETDIEAFKGSISRAFVRAASNWGVGRYLYQLTDNWAIFTENKKDYGNTIKDKKTGKEEYHYWKPPQLPDWALPKKQSTLSKPIADMTMIELNTEGQRIAKLTRTPEIESILAELRNEIRLRSADIKL